MYFRIRIEKHLETFLKTIENINIEGQRVTLSLDKSVMSFHCYIKR